MKAKIHKNYFDIVIIPPRPVMDYAIGLSKILYGQGAKWVLGKKNFVPHISLYHIPVKPAEFADFFKDLKKSVAQSKLGKLTFNDLYLHKIYNVVSWNADKPRWLNDLYLKVIKTALPYFDWTYGADKLWHLSKQTRLGKANFKKYGTPNVGRYFRPHITLGSFKDEDKVKIREVFSKLKQKKMSFAPDRLYIYELGTSHSCQRKVAEIKLK